MKKFLENLGTILLIFLTGGLYYLSVKNKRLEKQNGLLKAAHDIDSKNTEFNNTDLGTIVRDHNEEIKSRNKS